MAQCFGVMPLRGVKSKNVDDLHFTWRSLRTLYAVVLFVLIAVNTTLGVLYLYAGKFDFSRLGECSARELRHLQLMHRRTSPFAVFIIFSGLNGFALFSFVRLGQKWPRLMKSWATVEQQLPALRTQLERARLAYDIKILTIVILTMSLS